MYWQDRAWDLFVIIFTLQIAIASVIFYLLSGYNKKHQKLVETAHACVGKSSSSLFELPAFRGKTVPAPFENNTWLLPFYEQMKLSLVAVTLFPLRLVGFIVAFFGSFLLVNLLQRLGLQRLARATVTIAGRLILFSFGFMWISVKGKLAPGIGVLVSNHSTFLDGIVWVAMADTRIFAEKANFANPVMQGFAKALDIVLFDRSGTESRRLARQLMASSAQDAYEGKKPPILVFPTGTTTNVNVVITFKDGAFAPGLPVQPAILQYRFRHCDPAWVFSGPGTLMLIFKLMCQFYNTLEIEFLPVHHPTDEEKEEPHKFARSVQIKVAEALKVPVTEHSVEDLQLQFAAVKASLPAEVGVVGFSALKEVFSVDATQIKQQLNVFKEMDPKGSGLIGFAEFKDCFRRGFHEPSAEQSELLRHFFEQLTGGSAHMNFRNFLIGLALVNENEKEIDKNGRRPSDATTFPIAEVKDKIYAKLAFAAFAAESDERISWNEFKELWSFLHPTRIDLPLLKALGIEPEPPLQQRSNSFRRLFGRIGSNSERFERQESEESEVDAVARQVFHHIAGGNAKELTWEQFSAYAEKTPVFVKDLRQSFFSRIAQDLAPQK